LLLYQCYNQLVNTTSQINWLHYAYTTVPNIRTPLGKCCGSGLAWKVRIWSLGKLAKRYVSITFLLIKVTVLPSSPCPLFVRNCVLFMWHSERKTTNVLTRPLLLVLLVFDMGIWVTNVWTVSIKNHNLIYRLCNNWGSIHLWMYYSYIVHVSVTTSD